MKKNAKQIVILLLLCFLFSVFPAGKAEAAPHLVEWASKSQPDLGQYGTWKKDKYGWWFKRNMYGDIKNIVDKKETIPKYPVDGWWKINGKWYYFDTNGYCMVPGKDSWRTMYYTDGREYKYYIRGNGSLVTGWYKIPSGAKVYWYYFDQYGHPKTGWVKTGGKWYHCNNGRMQTGWIKVNNKDYFLQKDGSMYTGKSMWNGKHGTEYGEYYFDSTGACLNYKGR